MCYYTFLPNIADRRGDATLPHSPVHSILAQRFLTKFLQGFPPATSFNKFTRSDPARENFQHNSHSVLSIRNSQKPQKPQQITVRSSHSEAAAHSKGLPTSRKFAPNNTSSGHRVANVDTSQHTKRLAKVFRSPFRSPWQVEDTTLNAVCSKKLPG